MSSVTSSGSLKLHRRILNALRAPRFVYRYQLHDKDPIARLERKVVDRTAAAKYDWYLTNYNTMLLFEWPRDNTIDRNYYWRAFANSMNRPAAEDKKLATVYLSDKIRNRALDNCLGTKIASGPVEHRCLFQNGLQASSLAQLVDSATKSVGGPRLKAVALRISLEGDKRINEFVTSLQPVLEESMNMYKDVHYGKLLQIAKQAKNDNSVKEVLAKLAENDLSSPKLVRNNSWLMFASSKQSKEGTQ